MIQDIKLRIWSLSGQSLEIVNKAREGISLDETTVEYWEAVERNVSEIMKPKKRTRKNPPNTLTGEQKQKFRDAKYAYEERTFKHWIPDGHFIEPDYPNVATANGLTDYICSYLKWSGHFANRTNNMGVKRKDKHGKEIYTKSSSIKGMQDIDVNLTHENHPYGIP